MKRKKVKLATFIDLFSGIGGFRLALEKFGLRCVWTNDNDEHCAQTYEDNFGERPNAKDIAKVPAKIIPPHDVLCAGFPCQAFSISGRQRGFKDTRGTLFFDIVRIAKYHKPKILFLENVKNFARHDKSRTLQAVCNTLDDIGYEVYCQILNASEYGVPQSRKRIYFIAFRKELKIKNFDFPTPTFEQIRLKDVLEPRAKTKKYIIQRNDIKFYDAVPKLKKNIWNNYPLAPIQIGIINKGGQGERIYSPEGHAITLSAYGGGPGAKTGAYLVNGVVRKLSPRECARVMGFPEDFKIPVTDNQAYKLFGNSVAVPVLTCIFKEVLNNMTKIKSGSKPAKRGYLYENKFVELVSKNEKFNQALKKLFKIKGTLKAERITDTKKKTDVKLIVNDKKEIGLSIKTSEANFNQLERVWLKKLAKRHNMPKNIKNKINKCLREKSKNRRGKFISDKYRDEILNYFKRNLKPILKGIFSKNEENLKYLAVCVFAQDKWYIAPIDKVIKEISKSKLSTTAAGVIKIGDYLTLQRKGGDGAHVKLPKSDPRHPGNQLQFKIKPISLLDLNIFQEIKH